MKNTKNSFFIPFIVFAILILIVAFSLKNVYELNNNSKWVVHTHEVKMALAKNLSLLIDMETGQRGFSLTGNRDFLEYENSAKPQIQKSVLYLQTLIKDNPSQLQKLDSLKQLIDLKIAFNVKVIKAREQFGLNAAVVIISTRKGKQIMDDARKLSDNMLEVEEKLLNKRNIIATNSYFLAQFFVLVGGILSILIAIFLMIINYKSLKLKNIILQSEEKFKSIFDNSLAAVLVADDKGNYLSANKAAGKLLGYSVNELLQMNVGDLKTTAQPGAAKRYEEYIRKGEETGEFDFITKNGEHKLAQYQASRTTADFNLSVLMDITAQKQASEYTRSLIEASLDPLVTISPEGKITDVNEASVKVTGETREKLIGTDFSDYFTEPEKAREGYKQVFEKGFVSDYPLTIRHATGKLTDVLYNASVYKDDEGNVLGVFAAARDVTEQKQASQYARSLIEASLDPLVTISPEGKITDVNEASAKATGEKREKLIGTDFSDYFTEPEKAREGYKQVFDKGFVSDYPLTIRHATGKLTDVLYNASVYKDDEGNVLGVFAAARDVTEQRQASQYARSLIEASLDPLVTISAEGKITDVNEASVKVTGVPREDLIGTDFSDYFTEPEKALEGYQKVFEKGFVSDYPLTVRHSSGKLNDVLYNASVYKDDKGNVLGVFAAARDVTAQKAEELIISNKELAIQNKEKEKKAEELSIANKELVFQNNEKEKRAAELIIANKELAFQNDEKEKRAEELRIANKELLAFTYISSHDLQEPLRKIQTFAMVILEEENKNLSDEGKFNFERMRSSAERMQQLIEDLLAFSRISTTDHKFEKTELSTIVEEIKTELKDAIQEKRATIESNELCCASIIPFQFRQLMYNLISNALKFANPKVPSQIIIKSSIVKGSKLNTEKLSPEKNYCHIIVKDNGIGFEPHFGERIFGVFQKLHNKEVYGGTGIGLAIVKKIVENHNGIITATSELNKGATFDIYIPAN